MVTDKSKKPELRFKGFSDDWEQRKLSNVAEIVGGGTPSTLNPDYWDGDIDWYAPAEIGKQIFANGSIRKITKDGLNHCSAKILPAYKTVLFTSRAGIGNMAILQRSAATNQGFQSLVCHDNIDPYFVFSMGDNIKIKAKHIAAGSTFAEISGKKLGALEFMFPDADEQKAIGAYFMSLDKLITLHQRKCENLKIIKKSMLDNLFPKNGEKIPRWRFKGFNDDWEQCKLGDEALEILAGGDVDKSRLVENGKYPVIANALTDDGIVGYYEDNFRVKAPAVTVTGRGDVGHAQARKVNFTPVVRLLSVTSNHDVDFLAEAINQNNVVLESTGVPQLTVPKLASYKLFFPPTIEEERKIGQYFLNLDHLITLHQSEVERLKKVKQFFLDKMFI